jgi:hypothetical protein
MTALDKRRRQLRALYGLDFPEDFFLFWQFATRRRPLEPLAAIAEATDMHLVGPFEVLAGRFDARRPKYSQLLHWRYYLDPPEFFTVLAGGGDGLHLGYYLDDPASGQGCLAYYYAADVFEFAVAGDTLFEAVRLELEDTCGTCLLDRSYFPEHARDFEATLRSVDRLRADLCRYGTADQPERGEEYVDKYGGVSAREQRVVAATQDNIGIVVPAQLYRPLSLTDRKLWARLRRDANPRDLVDEALQALGEGFPGTALKLGKDLWAAGGEHQTMYSYELLDAAYAALGREELRRVLREHRAQRELPTVDILEAEAQQDGGQD